MTFTPS